VDRIVDGDTITVRARRPGTALTSTRRVTVRLLEVDSPETKKPGTPVQCYGPEATRYTARLLPRGSMAYVLPDHEPRDRYGRYLLYVWTARGAFVEDEIIRTGHGRAGLYPPNDRYIRRFRATQVEAQAARRGLWSACRTNSTAN
jgi:micrococcal nuclease